MNKEIAMILKAVVSGNYEGVITIKNSSDFVTITRYLKEDIKVIIKNGCKGSHEYTFTDEQIINGGVNNEV